MISSMVKATKHFKMALAMKGTTSMVKKKAKASTSGPKTTRNMKVNGKTIRWRVSAALFGVMVANIGATGLII